ncbi:hypothetical protein DFH07DRAFT_803932 [Mycena maculata]|uniref:Uncharacterized protein n=1 Tax=Mycena maculata TaxID=230809 RepID=A0AAD7NR74_9AGAR|nr:hypothetical protein DFH07DRAFT_803932 [Mycena maculata]
MQRFPTSGITVTPSISTFITLLRVLGLSLRIYTSSQTFCRNRVPSFQGILRSPPYSGMDKDSAYSMSIRRRG